VSVRPALLAGLLGSLISAAAPAVAMTSNDLAPVVLLGTAEDEPLSGRIAAELRSLGFAVDIRVIAGDKSGIDLGVESALREGARAAVRVDAATGRTEVSIPDPVTGEVTLKQVLEGPPAAALAPVLAVRTVEFVRAMLLGPRNEELRRNRVEGAAPETSRPAAEAVVAEIGAASGAVSIAASPVLGLTLDSGAIFTPGGLDTEIAIGVVARLRLFRRVGVELMGFTPLTTNRIDGTPVPSGTQISASTWLAGAGLFARQPLGSRVGLEVAAGAMIALLQVSGTAPQSSGLTGVTDWTVGGSVYGRLGADLAIAHNLALRLDLLGGGAFREAKLALGVSDPSSRRTAWARSFGAALGGVEARWF
jgi:hypothetical protein